MDKVANLPQDDRAALFEETAARARLAAPIIVEKDFWVCWALKRLYSMPGTPAMLFKGGTSLSKCFGLIHRFSEDIDLGLERRDIGLGGDRDPMSKSSRKGYQRALKEMMVTVREYVEGTLIPAIRTDFTQALGEDFELKLEPEGIENVIMFRYPRALEATSYGHGDYVASVVRLEVGARADHHPAVDSEIQSYAAEHLPDEFVQPGCRVIAQAPERSLLEKALILHTGNSKGRFSARTSRHAYDLAMMHRAGITETANLALYEEVAHHKLVFGDDIHASRAPEESIKVAPEGEALISMAADYRSMQAMFFTDPPPPAFDEVLTELRALESALNAL